MSVRQAEGENSLFTLREKNVKCGLGCNDLGQLSQLYFILRHFVFVLRSRSIYIYLLITKPNAGPFGRSLYNNVISTEILPVKGKI